MYRVRDTIAKCGNKKWWREKSVIPIGVQQVAAEHYQRHERESWSDYCLQWM